MQCDPAQHKLKNFPLLHAVNQSEASRNFFRKIYNRWGKGYFAAFNGYVYLHAYIEIYYGKYCNS